jgi:hypothetical protein
MSRQIQTISVNGSAVNIFQIKEQDYISLTDMIKSFGGETILLNWLRNRNTLEFIGIWEQLNNPNFKPLEFDRFKKEAGLNSFSLSPRKWIDATNAIGMISKAGRYGGGTFAHKDIAFEFGSWLSPEFKLYLIKEYQRLKEDAFEARARMESSPHARKSELPDSDGCDKRNAHSAGNYAAAIGDYLFFGNGIIERSFVRENDARMEKDESGKRGNDARSGYDSSIGYSFQSRINQFRFYPRQHSAKRTITETKCNCHHTNEIIADGSIHTNPFMIFKPLEFEGFKIF